METTIVIGGAEHGTPRLSLLGTRAFRPRAAGQLWGTCTGVRGRSGRAAFGPSAVPNTDPTQDVDPVRTT